MYSNNPLLILQLFGYLGNPNLNKLQLLYLKDKIGDFEVLFNPQHCEQEMRKNGM